MSNKRTVVILNQDQMGSGEPAFSQKILGTLLRKVLALEDLDAIVFYNTGVKLVARDSPVFVELNLLADKGIDLMPCGTCVEHYGVDVQVGKISDMDAILRELDGATKVVTI